MICDCSHSPQRPYRAHAAATCHLLPSHDSPPQSSFIQLNSWCLEPSTRTKKVHYIVWENRGEKKKKPCNSLSKRELGNISVKPTVKDKVGRAADQWHGVQCSHRSRASCGGGVTAHWGCEAWKCLLRRLPAGLCWYRRCRCDLIDGDPGLAHQEAPELEPGTSGAGAHLPSGLLPVREQGGCSLKTPQLWMGNLKLYKPSVGISMGVWSEAHQLSHGRRGRRPGKEKVRHNRCHTSEFLGWDYRGCLAHMHRRTAITRGWQVSTFLTGLEYELPGELQVTLWGKCFSVFPHYS